MKKLLKKIRTKIQNYRKYRLFREKKHVKRSNAWEAIAGYIDRHHGESNWTNIATPLTGILSLAIYLSVGIVYADYKGEGLIYILTSVSMGILFVLLIREALLCIGNNGLRKIWDGIKSKWKLKAIRAVIVIVVFCCFKNYSPTKYYSAITEIYGIPRGVESTALSKNDLKNYAGYWKIKENKVTDHVTLTYVDAYEQTDVMQHYSTLYNMALFQNPARIEIDYKKPFNKKKYRVKSLEAYNAADENKFREPTKICYYNSSGKLLLKMQCNEGLYKVSDYSSKDAPQLLNSLLFRIPDGQTVKNDIYLSQIEVTYNSAGLPETRRIVSGANSYGVCGESYTYNSNNQISTLYFLDSYGMPVCNNIGIMTIDFQYDDSGNLQSICYYSDVDKTEKTNGFSGVFCEKFHYENGNLTERLQLGQNGDSSYDMNTVCKYCYTYENGALTEETYYGRNNSSVYIKLDNLLCHGVKYNKDKNFFKREISISFDLKPAQSSSETNNDTSASFYPEGSNLSSNNKTTAGNTSQTDTVKYNAGDEASGTDTANGKTLPKNRPAESDTELNTNTTPSANYTVINFQEINFFINDTPMIREENIDSPLSTYAAIRFTIHRGAIKKMQYLDQKDSPTVNEHGCAAREFKYNKNKRLIKETYLDVEDQKCLIDDGYAAVETIYADKSSEQIQYIKYLDTTNRLINNKVTGYAMIEYKYGNVPGEDSNSDTASQDTVSEPYSRQERAVTEYYRDQNDQLVLSRDLGYAIIKKTYNENGLLAGEAYFGTDNKPAYRSDYGVAQILYEYSSIGNPVCEQYLDPDGNPLNRIDTGYAIIYREYEMGRKVKEYYEGMQDGMLCSVTDKNNGVAAKTFGYSNGQMIEEAYYDINQRPVLCSNMGCAKVTYEYESGKLCKTSYYGTSAELTLRKDLGAAVVRYEYDDAGRKTFTRYYDTDEKPVISTKYCCAGFHYNYNDMQQDESDIFYIGPDGNPMIRKDLGFAHVHYEYDDDGNISYESYWDAEDKPALYKDRGYAAYAYAYDKKRDCAEYRYYDADGDPVMRRDYGYAYCIEYYENEKCKERRYYDTWDAENLDERLVLRKDKGYAIVRYDYNESGQCISEKFYDTKDNPVISTEYQCAGFIHEYDEVGHEKSIGFTGKDDEPFIRGDKGYAFERYEYDQSGNYTSIRYYGVDGKTPMISSVYNCAGFDYQHDDRGNESEVHYIGPDGKPMFRRDYGNVWVRKKYDDVGNFIGEAYYNDQDEPAVWRENGYASIEYTLESGNIRQIRYYDVRHKLTIRHDEGYAVEEREYDNAGRCIARLYYDTHGQLILCGDNKCAGFRYAYDEMGNQTDTWCLGVDGNTMLCRELGYAHIQYEYDELGRQIRKCLFDVADKPILHLNEGYASCEYDYDAAGNQLEIRYYDTYGHLTARTDTGCAVEKYEYNPLGQCTLVQYFDLWDEQPVIHKEYHCAGFEYKYDDRCRRSDIFYLGTDGKPMIRSDIGISYLHKRFDDFGRLEGEDYFAVNYTNDEKEGYEYTPAVWKGRGYSSFTNEYENGHCIRTCYEDDGDYVLRKDKNFAKVEWEYDEYGQCTAEIYLGADNELIISDQQCAGFRYAFDKKGQQTDTWYIGPDDKPMNRDDMGFAHIHSDYDEMGNEIMVTYSDANEEPTFRKNRPCAAFKKSFLDGKCIAIRYYDANEQPIGIDNEGYAYYINFYEGGNCIETRYYDTNDYLFSRLDEGYAVCRKTYDALGEEMLCLYYDATGEKTVINSNYNFAGWQYAYDSKGNQTDIWYLGPDGKPLTDEVLGYAHIHYDYNDLNQCIRTSYFDADENPSTFIGGGYSYMEQTYKGGNCIEERYYDTDQNLVLRTDTGYAVVKYTYNELWQEEGHTYYGTGGERVNDKEGFAGYFFAYDDRGNQTTIWHMDTAGYYSRHDNTGGECQYKEYDEYDNLISDKNYYYFISDDGEAVYQLIDSNI